MAWPDDSAAEAAEDERFAAEYEAQIRNFQRQLRSGLSPAHLCGVLARVCGSGPAVMPADDDYIHFADRWGFEWLLRAFATAVALERPLRGGSIPSRPYAHAPLV